MLPTKNNPPPQEPDLLDLAAHQNFLNHPATARAIKKLTAEHENLLAALLNDFETLPEVPLKLVLQRIKTIKHTITCLTQIPKT